MEKKVTKKEAKQVFLQNNKRVVDETADGFVVLRDIDKIYDNNVQAVHHFNLSVKRNEFIVLVGPSGCGKSTTLRMVAGLEEITDGYLYIDQLMANYLESKDRDIAMVFQSYALYPNMTVFENIAFGLRVRGLPNDEIKEKVFNAAKILDLGAYLDRRPKELSGGQMQRVALGRAIVRNAKLFLMDEPLSNLDAKLRVQMRSEIVKLHKDIHATTIYVTHDQTEAMTMADRIVIMNKGFIQQIGSPFDIYNNPSNVFVATFIGNPPMNIFEVTAPKDGVVGSGAQKITVPKEFMKRSQAYAKDKASFFRNLLSKCDLTEENAVSVELKQIFTGVNKLIKAQSLHEKVKAVTQRLIDLSESKGFFPFTAERQTLMNECAATNNVKLLKTEILEILEHVNRTALAIAGILKETDSAGISVKKEAEIVSTGKNKKKKEKVKNDAASLHLKNIEGIKAYIDAYEMALSGETRLTLGIRPENIHIADSFEGNKSETLTVYAEFVELMGSEYCVHVKLFDKKIIIKMGVSKPIMSGDKIDICFDLDRLKIFDSVSGKNIN